MPVERGRVRKIAFWILIVALLLISLFAYWRYRDLKKILILKASEKSTSENANRRTVINGMTRAIIRINRVPESEQNLKQVMPQAGEQFAALRRDSAKKGWWVQSPDGNWTRK
jgi:hypothetical protein